MARKVPLTGYDSRDEEKLNMNNLSFKYKLVPEKQCVFFFLSPKYFIEWMKLGYFPHPDFRILCNVTIFIIFKGMEIIHFRSDFNEIILSYASEGENRSKFSNSS